MLESQELRRLASAAASPLLEHEWKVWFWGDSIGVEGLIDATEMTGEGKYLGFAHGLLKGWMARQRFRSAFDYTAPGVGMLRVYEASRDAALLDCALRHAEYMEGFRRTAAGAYVRYENAAMELPPAIPSSHPERAETRRPVEDGGPCVFVDSVHFDGPFFAKLFQVTGEARYRDLALANILPQIELLYDTDQRLFHHFWSEREGRSNGVAWGRGNGWGLLGVALVLEFLGAEGGAVQPLLEVLRNGLARLAELQDASGAWHTILTDETSYVEASTAAFFIDVICRAVRLGVVCPKEYGNVVEAAWRFLLRHTGEDGILRGVSYETFPSMRAEHYRCMPRGAVVPWGQGPLLAALRSSAGVTEFAGRLNRLATEEQLHAAG